MNEGTLWGIPVVVTEECPKSTAYLGRLPTPQEIEQWGSLEKALKAMAEQWVKIENIDA